MPASVTGRLTTFSETIGLPSSSASQESSAVLVINSNEVWPAATCRRKSAFSSARFFSCNAAISAAVGVGGPRRHAQAHASNAAAKKILEQEQKGIGAKLRRG